jgi:hypothetical protein
MNCAEVNQTDLVDYLHLLGHQPTKIRNNDYWYLSPLRAEKEPSFKVNKSKNVWYDHGLGKGGALLNFATEYFHCGVREALEKISCFHRQNYSPSHPPKRSIFRPQPKWASDEVVPQSSIRILAVKQPITDLSLLSYLKKRRIPVEMANVFCHEVSFELNEKNYRAIGFKNESGGYELRNEYFKAGSSPKLITYINNHSDTVSVFEGFFDFLTYQTMLEGQEQPASNFIVLNSLSFFERSLLLMEKHARVKLYLDFDQAGRKYTELGLKRSSRFQDESKLYKGYKDLNEWFMYIGKGVGEQQALGKEK